MICNRAFHYGSYGTYLDPLKFLRSFCNKSTNLPANLIVDTYGEQCNNRDTQEYLNLILWGIVNEVVHMDQMILGTQFFLLFKYLYIKRKNICFREHFLCHIPFTWIYQVVLISTCIYIHYEDAQIDCQHTQQVLEKELNPTQT